MLVYLESLSPALTYEAAVALLDILCQAKDQTFILALQRQCPSHFATVGTPPPKILQIVKC